MKLLIRYLDISIREKKDYHITYYHTDVGIEIWGFNAYTLDVPIKVKQLTDVCLVITKCRFFNLCELSLVEHY